MMSLSLTYPASSIHLLPNALLPTLSLYLTRGMSVSCPSMSHRRFTELAWLEKSLDDSVTRLTALYASLPKEYANVMSRAKLRYSNLVKNEPNKSGVDELKMNKLKTLLELKFGSVPEGISALGGAPMARQVFKDFQYRLYA